MDCIKVRNLLEAYFESALESAEALVVKRHITSCPDCQKELQEIQTTVGLIEALPYKERALLISETIGVNRRRKPFWWIQHRFVSMALAAGILCAIVLYLMITPADRVKPTLPDTSSVEKPVLVARGLKAVSGYTGDFLVKLKGTESWNKLPAETYLIWGDSVKTGGKQKTYLKFSSGLEINLKEMTVLALKEKTPDSFFLESGSISVQTSASESEIQIDTPAGNIKPMGTKSTRFLVELKPGEEITQPSAMTGYATAILAVSVFEGGLRLETVYGNKEIKSGETIVMNPQEEQKKQAEETLRVKTAAILDDIVKALVTGQCYAKELILISQIGKPAIPILSETLITWDAKVVKPSLARIEELKGLPAGELQKLIKYEGYLMENKELIAAVGEEYLNNLVALVEGQASIENTLAGIMVEADMPVLFNAYYIYDSFFKLAQKGDYKKAERCLSNNFQMVIKGEISSEAASAQVIYARLVQEQVGKNAVFYLDSQDQRFHQCFYAADKKPPHTPNNDWDCQVILAREGKRVWKIEKIEFK
jgi:hypothetical protein